jgi:hypothetical protein
VPKPGGTAHWDLKSISGYANLLMTSFTYFTGDTRTTDYDFGVYRGTQEWYNLMRGYKPVPLTPLQCSIDPTTNQCTMFEISGDAQLFRGWVDGRSDTLGDRRFAMISGPFSMALGDTQEVIYSLMGAIGSSHRQSVGELLTIDDHAQDTYNVNFELADSLPSPPLRIVELDKAFIFDWESDTAGVHRVESYKSLGFKFETYNIYQFASPTATLDQATPFPPFDISLPRSMNVDNDLIRDHALVNGQKYYYAVTAQYYNPDPLVANPRIESPLRILTVTPHSPNPGVVYPYGIGEVATNSSNLKHVVGYNDAKVTTSYYDPTRTDEHTYKLRFHRVRTCTSTSMKINVGLYRHLTSGRGWWVETRPRAQRPPSEPGRRGNLGVSVRPGGQLSAVSFADVVRFWGRRNRPDLGHRTGESWTTLVSGTTRSLFGCSIINSPPP